MVGEVATGASAVLPVPCTRVCEPIGGIFPIIVRANTDTKLGVMLEAHMKALLRSRVSGAIGSALKGIGCGGHSWFDETVLRLPVGIATHASAKKGVIGPLA